MPRKQLSEPAAPRVRTVGQIEQSHSGLSGRMRAWIYRADHGDPEFATLRPAIIRIGRSVLIDEGLFLAFLREKSLQAPAPARNPDGRAGKAAA
jgi:hypothetical protein